MFSMGLVFFQFNSTCVTVTVQHIRHPAHVTPLFCLLISVRLQFFTLPPQVFQSIINNCFYNSQMEIDGHDYDCLHCGVVLLNLSMASSAFPPPSTSAGAAAVGAVPHTIYHHLCNLIRSTHLRDKWFRCSFPL